MEVLAGAVAVLVPAAFVLRELARRPDGPTAPTPDPVAQPEPRAIAAVATPVEPSAEEAPRTGFAHAPVYSPVAAPGTVSVRVSPRPRPVAPATKTAPAPAPATVLGVFGDTEPDRRTEGARRAASALVLAAVTATVATVVGGVIYLGLSRLG